MLQLHLNDQQFYCPLRCDLYQMFTVALEIVPCRKWKNINQTLNKENIPITRADELWRVQWVLSRGFSFTLIDTQLQKKSTSTSSQKKIRLYYFVGQTALTSLWCREAWWSLTEIKVHSGLTWNYASQRDTAATNKQGTYSSMSLQLLVLTHCRHVVSYLCIPK